MKPTKTKYIKKPKINLEKIIKIKDLNTLKGDLKRFIIY